MNYRNLFESVNSRVQRTIHLFPKWNCYLDFRQCIFSFFGCPCSRVSELAVAYPSQRSLGELLLPLQTMSSITITSMKRKDSSKAKSKCAYSNMNSYVHESYITKIVRKVFFFLNVGFATLSGCSIEPQQC